MRDDDAGAAGEQPVARRGDALFGLRVHPRAGLVEDDDRDVADQQPGEGNQLLLARGQGCAADPEAGMQPLGQGAHPAGQAQRLVGALHRGPGDVGEQRGVLLEGGRQHLGALGDHADGAPELLDRGVS